MFGLINHCKACQEGYKSFRQNYCETCKSIGVLYGQRERYFLNNDIVFLSELLSEINNCETDFKYIKVNSCFKLPKNQEQVPEFLKYTASINIILSYFKILDNIEDSKFKFNGWRIFKFIEAPTFLKSKMYLESCGFEISFIESLLKQQFDKEKDKKQFVSLQDSLEYYSEITGEITGEVFRQGAILLQKKDLSDLLYQIGQKFGEIVYLIDAIQDIKKDAKQNKFNPFLLTEISSNIEIKPIERKVALDYVSLKLSVIQELINLLPISENKKVIFNNRLFYSINEVISEKSKNEKHHCDYKKYLTIRERFRYAIKASKSKTIRIENIVFRNIVFFLLASSFLIIFLLFPNYIYANDLMGIQEHNCCGSCCGGTWSCCCNCCSCGECKGTSESKCGYGLGDSFQGVFCQWPECLGLPCICTLLCGIPSGICGSCCGDSVEKPNVIVIFKEKEGCGC